MSLFRGENVVDPALPGSTFPVSSGPFAAATVPTIIFLADAAYQVVGIAEVHSTASSSGTLQLEKLNSTDAPTAGDNLLTGTMSTAGTANTPVYGTIVTTTPALPILAKGDRLALVTGGTQTSLVGAIVTVTLKRL